MNSKKLTYFLIVLVIILGSIFVITKIPKKEEKGEEYIPQEEISDKQAMQTLVTLYYINSDTGELLPEAR